MSMWEAVCGKMVEGYEFLTTEYTEYTEMGEEIRSVYG